MKISGVGISVQVHGQRTDQGRGVTMTRDAAKAEQPGIQSGSPLLPGAIAQIMTRLFERFSAGALTVELPTGERVHKKANQAGPEAIMRLVRWRALRRLLANGDIGFAEGYIEGDWTTPNLTDLFEWAHLNEAALTPIWSGSRLERFIDRLRHARRKNTRRGSRRNIQDHYDLGNDFYAAWLDNSMNYSSALYTTPDMTLEAAQSAKLERVIDLLDPAPDLRVLEIGCGWGALAERLIETHSCHVTGLTLSREQQQWAQKRLSGSAYTKQSEILLKDYRDETRQFDRIVSIEMFEAAGESYWKKYFEKLRACLRPGGVAVLQVITIEADRFDSYRRRPDFIQRYIFPGGMLPTVAHMQNLAAETGLELASAEWFGNSYARTLKDWRDRFGRTAATLPEPYCTARFRNMWEYYLAYCEVGFRHGAIDVGLYQLKR